MAYSKISYTGVHKGKVQVITSMYLEPTDPNYDKNYVYIVDWSSPEVQLGYQGKVNEVGEPLDLADYEAWEATLPRIWQNNPFHNHAIYCDKDTLDSDIKNKIKETMNYFYTFHQQMWDEGKEFIDEWKKVPRVKGTMRDTFTKGSLNPKDIADCETKARDIKERADQIVPIIKKIEKFGDLNIGKRGTIDIGSAAIDRNSSSLWYYSGSPYTDVAVDNPANADGTIDTIEVWMNSVNNAACWAGTFSASGNVLTCRDSASIGTPAAGSKQTTTGLSIDVLTGDYIGGTAKTADGDSYVEKTSGSGAGMWIAAGEYIDPSDSTTFSLNSDRDMSLYGTGTEAAPGGWASGDVNGVAVGTIKNIKGVALTAIKAVNGVT